MRVVVNGNDLVAVDGIFRHHDLEGNYHITARGDILQVPGDGVGILVIDTVVGSGILHIFGAGRDDIGGHGIGGGFAAVDDLNGIGQLIAHHNGLAVGIDNAVRLIGVDVHVLGLLALEAQLAVVTQNHSVVRVGYALGSVGVGNDFGSLGKVAVLPIAGGCGIVLVDVFAAGQRGSLVQALGNVPLAIGVLDLHICGDIHGDVGSQLIGSVRTVRVCLGTGPVVVLAGIVVAVAHGLVVSGVGNVVVTLLHIDQGIFLIGVETVVRRGVEGSGGTCAVVAVFGLVAIPVVGVEGILAVGGVVGVLGLAIDHGSLVLVGFISADDLIHVERIDVAAQTHLIDNMGRIGRSNGCGVAHTVLVLMLGNHDLLNGQQTCGSADHHGLLIRRGQGSLHTHHEIQELFAGGCGIITGGAVVEVGTADIVRILGNPGAGIGDVLDGIVIGKAQDLDLLVFLTGGGEAVAPPDDAVVVAGCVGICLVGRVEGGIDQIVHIHHGAGQLAALLQNSGERILEALGSGVPVLDVLGEGLATIPLTVDHNAVHLLDFHVFTNGIGEGNVTGEVSAEGSIHPGGRRHGLLLDAQHHILECLCDILFLIGSKVIVIVLQAALVHDGTGAALAVDSVTGSPDAGGSNLEVVVTVNLDIEVLRIVFAEVCPVSIEV